MVMIVKKGESYIEKNNTEYPEKNQDIWSFQSGVPAFDRRDPDL